MAAIGLYAALFVAIESFQARYAELANSVSSLYDTLRHVRDYFDFVDEPREDPEAGEHLPGPVAREIVFKDVSFTYPGADRPAVSELNLTIRPGERIALVGENGAGKTTLVKLLMGLYRPTSGRILVDGTDLCELAPADWHRRFGTVFQHYLRLQATVRENVALGAIGGSSDDPALAAAVARSGADEMAARLPGGLETPLGRDFHEGSELSVGQWQKLAIAPRLPARRRDPGPGRAGVGAGRQGGGGGVPPLRTDGRGADRDPDLAPARLLPACRAGSWCCATGGWRRRGATRSSSLPAAPMPSSTACRPPGTASPSLTSAQAISPDLKILANLWGSLPQNELNRPM